VATNGADPPKRALLLSPNLSSTTAIRGVIAFDGEHSRGLPGRRDRIRMKAIVGARPAGLDSGRSVCARRDRPELRPNRAARDERARSHCSRACASDRDAFGDDTMAGPPQSQQPATVDPRPRGTASRDVLDVPRHRKSP